MNKKLLGNSVIFVVGDVVNKAIPFFMLPILTRYLTPEDYGIISIFGVFIAIISIFAGLNVAGAINVNFFKFSKESLRIYIGNTFLILNISTIIIFFIVFLIHPYLMEKFSLSQAWIYMAVLLAFAQFFTTLNMLLWVAEQKAKVYSFYQFAQTLTTTLLSILFVVVLGLGWQGQLVATSLGTIVFALISLLFIVKRGYLLFKPNIGYIKDALKFGVPLIPHSLSGWIKTGADRMILMYLVGSVATGIYSVSYQIGMVIGILVMAFNKAWIPYFMKTLSQDPTYKEKIKIVKFTYLYFGIVILIALGFSFISHYIIPYFLGNKFLDAAKYIIYFALAFAFQGMYFMVGNYIFYVKRTSLLAYVTFATSILHILILYNLVKMNGEIGAAQTMLITYIVTFVSVWFLSQKVYPMPWIFWRDNK